MASVSCTYYNLRYMYFQAKLLLYLGTLLQFQTPRSLKIFVRCGLCEPWWQYDSDSPTCQRWWSTLVVFHGYQLASENKRAYRDLLLWAEIKLPNEAYSDILGFLLNLDMMKSNSPQRCTSGSAFNLWVYVKVSSRQMPQI